MTNEKGEMWAAKVLPSNHAQQEIVGLEAAQSCRFSLRMLYSLVSSSPLNLADPHV